MNNEIKQTVLVDKIVVAFTKLKIDITPEQITQELAQAKKLGVTNTFFSVKTKEKDYLVRVNGTLWAPYKREDEAHVLNILKEHGIETNVLFHGEEFQISLKPNQNMRLDQLLQFQTPELVDKALYLTAQQIKKYQRLDGIKTKYPLEQMLADAESALFKKMANISEEKTILLKSFAEACHKILKVLEHANPVFTYSHTDLLPTSIYVDIEQAKVSIVDWEYSALSYWSNDIAMVSRSLTHRQKEIWLNHYHSIQCENNTLMPEEQKLQIQLNQHIQDFLNIAWKMTANNWSEFQLELDTMKENLSLFTKRLDIRHKKLTQGVTDSFFSFYQENPYNKDTISPSFNAILQG
ncbi:phosphotransferase [uncultured Legionella sp.]|uniref:phosphotransferase n=1 Tax=uncultured Legionella sp. TaxID=210934 RepID=UPI002638D9F4|nr:phosphotransferase [uncultured Legionella sp.]